MNKLHLRVKRVKVGGNWWSCLFIDKFTRYIKLPVKIYYVIKNI